MSTARAMQKPQIISFDGTTFRIKHPNLSERQNTKLAAPIAAAATAMSVYDNNGLSNGDYILVGQPGDNQTEEINVNASVTRGQSLTVGNTLKFGHELDAPITPIYERGIKLYGASTDGGSGTLIASIDAITTPIADAAMIQWNKAYTEITIISTDTTYSYYFVKFTDGTTSSNSSDYIPNSGHPYNAVVKLFQQALDATDTDVDGRQITWDMGIDWMQDWQSEVSQYTFKDPQSGLPVKKDWNHEIYEDVSTLTVSQNEDSYYLPNLLAPYPPKYIDSGRAIISVQIGDRQPLDFLEIDEFIRLMENTHRTQITADALIGATSIHVVSTGGFPTSGSLLLGTDTITYTGVTATTFTGIPASGDGSITADNIFDSGYSEPAVWNNITQSTPSVYTVLRGYLRFNVPPSASLQDYPIKIRYFRALARITELSDTTPITFTNNAIKYLKSRIEERKGNLDKSAAHKADFNDSLFQNAMADSQPTSQSYSYFDFDDPDDQMRWTRRFEQ